MEKEKIKERKIQAKNKSNRHEKVMKSLNTTVEAFLLAFHHRPKMHVYYSAIPQAQR